MPSSYSISEKALKDIDDIWLYTAENWSYDQANRYYALIFTEIAYIAKHFESCRDFSHKRAGYRFTKVKAHLIFTGKRKMIL